jgi:hypothetical protein
VMDWGGLYKKSGILSPLWIGGESDSKRLCPLGGCQVESQRGSECGGCKVAGSYWVVGLW